MRRRPGVPPLAGAPGAVCDFLLYPVGIARLGSRNTSVKSE
ncbi:hypothetical protein RA11412_0914 [Rothia aeria]|uniref:Uncharacterized protein n=1 Tax=Rothia aeria TaxID=172042 RepID=A0A2Z5QXZ5_9MICC|nr:hypothetical protein RA11412_0914 [Rothia aeria]